MVHTETSKAEEIHYLTYTRITSSTMEGKTPPEALSYLTPNLTPASGAPGANTCLKAFYRQPTVSLMFDFLK